uniref:STE20-related kinase adapter protein beta-like n=1 Tax=Seriola lalandi dorsalis TaxID=1841481 RepID=A0A3B4WQE4_SERLL
MTSQGCRLTQPTTSYCQSWVRAPHRTPESHHYVNFTSGHCVTGRGFNNLSQVSMARHNPTGQLVAVKQTNLDECVLFSDCVPNPQNEVLLSRLFRHPNLLTSRLVFSSCCQLWVLTPLMAYGSADTLLRTYFPDGMSESLIAYLLYGVLKALEYLHRMGYVHRSYLCFNVSLFIDYFSQGGEGQSYPAVRGGACLPLRAPQCLQYDA